jgi:hypothetical protein
MAGMTTLRRVVPRCPAHLVCCRWRTEIATGRERSIWISPTTGRGPMSSVESAADDALPLTASRFAAKPSYITGTALAHEGVASRTGLHVLERVDRYRHRGRGVGRVCRSARRRAGTEPPNRLIPMAWVDSTCSDRAWPGGAAVTLLVGDAQGVACGLTWSWVVRVSTARPNPLPCVGPVVRWLGFCTASQSFSA